MELQDTKHEEPPADPRTASADPENPPSILTPRTQVSLPDIDDNSMNAVLTYIKLYERDLYWSWVSDLFFLLGGTLYVVLSVLELVEIGVEAHPWIQALIIVAPLAYVFNSAIDIQWALQTEKRDKRKEMAIEHFDPNHYENMSQRVSIDEAVNRLTQCMKGFFFFFFHRRTLLAAVTFGMAAVCDFAADFLYEKAFAGIAVHLYIVSALASVTGERSRPWFSSIQTVANTASTTSLSRNAALTPTQPTKASLSTAKSSAEVFEDVGDLLFLIGSSIDAILLDLRIDRPGLSLASSVLWLLDSVCYLSSDHIMSRQVEKPINKNLLDESFVFI